MMTIQEIVNTINDGGYGFRVIPAGPGWRTAWLYEDKQTGLCSPVTVPELRDKAMQLGILQLNDAARALRAIPSERRSEQSRINGRKGGRPRESATE